MDDVFILFNVHFIVLYEDNCSLVMIFAAIIWRAENCDYRWECLMAAPTVHFVAIDLDLMGANDGNEVVLAQDLFDGVQTELDGTLSLHIFAETEFAGFSILHWVGPEEIAEEAVKGRFDESVDRVNVALALELRRDSTMHAEVVTVDVGGDGHSFE